MHSTAAALVRGVRTPVRRWTVATTALLIAAGLSVAATADMRAATWIAEFGPGGRYGGASYITATTSSGTPHDRVTVYIDRFRAATRYAVAIRRGTCASLGRLVVQLPSIATSRTGTAYRATTLTASQSRAVRSALRAGPVTLRVGSQCDRLLPISDSGPVASLPPIPTLPPGLGVPVDIRGAGEIVALAAEPWTDAARPAASGDTLVTVQLSIGDTLVADAYQPARLTLEDSAGASHSPLMDGRAPQVPASPGWLTFELPMTSATNVTLVWSAAGSVSRIPLHVEPPAGPSSVHLAFEGTPSAFRDASVTDAVGTPGEYVAVGYTEPAPGSRDQTGAVWTSTDGRAWSIRQPSTFAHADLQGIARGRTGRLLVIGSVSSARGLVQAMWTSDDGGRTWSRVPNLPTEPLLSSWRDVSAFGNGFVVVGSVPLSIRDTVHAAAMISTDGRTWKRSSFVDGATGRIMAHVLEAPLGLIGYGTVGEESNGPVAWMSSDGMRWRRTLEIGGLNSGGAESAAIDLVFRAGQGLIALSSYGGRPDVFESSDGTMWTRLSPGGALRPFSATAGGVLRDGTTLVAGRTPVAGLAVAWQYRATGQWLPVTVEAPPGEAPGRADEVINAIVDGPGGLIALGTDMTFGEQGVVWQVVEP